MLLAVLTLHLVATDPVGAPADDPAALMAAQVRDYFDGEESAAWGWFPAGLVATGAGGYALATSSNDVLFGAAIPVTVVGLVELGSALSLWTRSGGRRARLVEQVQQDPSAFIRDEGTRLRQLNNIFAGLRLIEIGAMGVGAGLGIYGAVAGDNDGRTYLGIGLGLLVQAAALYAFDHFAAERAALYFQQIEAFAAARGEAMPQPPSWARPIQ